MKFTRSYLPLVGLLFVVVLCPATLVAQVESLDRTAPPADQRRIRAAFLNVDDSKLGALLEAQLLEIANVDWVERTEFDAILGELELATLFGPEAGKERMQLGQLVKAEVIALVRESKPTAPAAGPGYEIVAFETHSGLRLAVHRVTPTVDSEADVAALATLVKAAIDKERRPIRAVYAVPPFVSNDLAFRYEYLKSAYARLVEQMLLARDGILVVELEEAHSIAREIAISEPGSGLERMMPRYILGEYRHEGDDPVQVSIDLELKSGEKQLAVEALLRLEPAAAPEAIRTAIAKLVAGAVDSKSPTSDKKAEIAQLLEREQIFRKLGDWQEALDLAEAALLLDPHHEPARVEAVFCSGRLAERFGSYNGRRRTDEANRALRIHQRGLEHFETLIQQYGDNELYEQGSFIWGFPFYALSSMGPNYQPSELFLETVQKQRKMLLRMVRLRTQQGKQDHSRYLMWAWGLDIEDVQYEEVFQIVGDLAARGSKAFYRR